MGEEEDPADDQKLYHRQGEAWIMENTWITGEKYPNDPFGAEMTVGQVDMLKRVIPGTYILEELEAPAGYVQSLPIGVTVTETNGHTSGRAAGWENKSRNSENGMLPINTESMLSAIIKLD